MTPDEVSRQLSIQDTKHWTETNPKTLRVDNRQPNHVWILAVQEEGCDDINRPLKTLLDQLSSAHDALKVVLQHNEVDSLIRISIFRDDINPIVYFGPETLAQLAMIGVGLEVDFLT
jgi:hypothetical protein